jgi:hypothetical protein
VEAPHQLLLKQSPSRLIFASIQSLLGYNGSPMLRLNVSSLAEVIILISSLRQRLDASDLRL